MNRYIREPFCGLSHLAGAALSLGGLVALIVLAHGRPWHVAAFVIYGVTLILLYTASALYHSLHVSERGTDRLKNLDHSGIFLLIAGTYTPMCLVALRGVVGQPRVDVRPVLPAPGRNHLRVRHRQQSLGPLGRSPAAGPAAAERRGRVRRRNDGVVEHHRTDVEFESGIGRFAVDTRG